MNLREKEREKRTIYNKNSNNDVSHGFRINRIANKDNKLKRMDENIENEIHFLLDISFIRIENCVYFPFGFLCKENWNTQRRRSSNVFLRCEQFLVPSLFITSILIETVLFVHRISFKAIQNRTKKKTWFNKEFVDARKKSQEEFGGVWGNGSKIEKNTS